MTNRFSKTAIGAISADANDSISWVQVHRLRGLCDPLANPPWEEVDALTIEGIRQAVEDGFFLATPFDPAALATPWSVDEHVARIAYLVAHGWSDPVSVDIGVPSLNCWVRWPLTDGNHRMVAAIVRGDEFIAAELSGCCETLAEIFGTTSLQHA